MEQKCITCCVLATQQKSSEQTQEAKRPLRFLRLQEVWNEAFWRCYIRAFILKSTVISERYRGVKHEATTSTKLCSFCCLCFHYASPLDHYYSLGFIFDSGCSTNADHFWQQFDSPVEAEEEHWSGEMETMCPNITGYSHAVLACDSVSMFRIMNKRHVHSNQRCPVCCQHLTPNDGHQAGDRGGGEGGEAADVTVTEEKTVLTGINWSRWVTGVRKYPRADRKLVFFNSRRLISNSCCTKWHRQPSVWMLPSQWTEILKYRWLRCKFFFLLEICWQLGRGSVYGEKSFHISIL